MVFSPMIKVAGGDGGQSRPAAVGVPANRKRLNSISKQLSKYYRKKVTLNR